MSVIKIEMGAGIKPRKKKSDGWLFNDVQELPGIDIVAPCNKLGMKPNTVDALYCSHMLEHIDWDLCIKTITYWKTLLKSCGELEIIVPNAGYAMREYLKCSSEGRFPNSMIYRVIWGTRDAGTEALPPHNVHHFGFTRKYLHMILSKLGFRRITVVHVNRFGIPDRDLKAYCIK